MRLGPSCRSLVLARSTLAAMTEALRVARSARRSSCGLRPGLPVGQKVVEHTAHTQGLLRRSTLCTGGPATLRRSSSL